MNRRLYTIFLAASVACAARAQDIASSIEKFGFHEVRNNLFLKRDYDNLYKNFDAFIDLMEKNPDFAQSMYDSEKAFLSQEANKSRYCSAPPSFRNPSVHKQKRFSKIYFQFVKEHYDLCREQYGKALINNFEAFAFLNGIAQVDKIAKEYFASILAELEKTYPGITAMMYGSYNELTVITKIVRYEQVDGEVWGTTAHVDKSALSLIWDSNDDNNESLVVCFDREHPSLSQLVQPVRQFGNSLDCSSAILIPGAACILKGIGMKPTVHGVLPIKKKYRTAIISFLLIPDTDMSRIVCDFKQG